MLGCKVKNIFRLNRVKVFEHLFSKLSMIKQYFLESECSHITNKSYIISIGLRRHGDEPGQCCTFLSSAQENFAASLEVVLLWKRKAPVLAVSPSL